MAGVPRSSPATITVRTTAAATAAAVPAATPTQRDARLRRVGVGSTASALLGSLAESSRLASIAAWMPSQLFAGAGSDGLRAASVSRCSASSMRQLAHPSRCCSSSQPHTARVHAPRGFRGAPRSADASVGCSTHVHRFR
jgi:hypothetical protein